jgi:energy-coupling factor transporter ATP-binding protein EcfA2
VRRSQERTKKSPAAPPNDPKELEDWFAERPGWLQDAARRIIQKGQIENDDLEQLVSICKAEAGIYDSDSQSLKASGVVQGSLRDIPKQNALRLKSMFDPSGINALSPRKPLEFAEERLTVVYGQNGSGKSGYVRALKQACGQREAGALLTNVFSASNEEQSCKFKYSIDGIPRETHWIFSNGPVNELKAIQVYDSQSALIYVNEEKETVYEPFVLSLFTQLTDVCGRVDGKLEGEINSKVSTKAELPAELLSTQLALWYRKLTDSTTDLEISERCQWSDELEAELTTLNQRVVETNPAEKARKLRIQKGRIENLHAELTQWNARLSDSNCEKYFEVARGAFAKRQAADADAATVFANAPLGGVASATWKLLWDQARAYSEEVAYQSIPFPNTGADARCVLCHQTLGPEAKQRFISFESFVRGGLETQAATAAEHVRQLNEDLNGIVPDEKLSLRMDSIGLTLEVERARLVAYCSALEARKVALLSVEQISQLPADPGNSDLRFLNERCDAIEGEATALDQDAKGENRPALEARQKELISQKWLFQQRTSVQREVSRLREIRKIENARKLASTYALSSKKSVLADTLITEAYVNRFQTELADLGAGQIKVKLVKTRAERGHVFHRVQLDNPKKSVGTSEVLSEGEFRMVSLAAFLADVEARKDGAPFVFDDPISSLDHIFEEATARRLVKLSKSRQVIVFTHRLSLVEYIENAAKKAGIDPLPIITLRREHWGPGEPGEPSINHMKPEGALDRLSERLRQAKEVLEKTGREAYEDMAKSICGDFRTAIECTIEKKLLNTVIKRYSREIQTKGKIKDLAKITVDDCTFFDDLMTKYSVYEHSQPSETPATSPEPDDIGADLRSVKAWISEFKGRQIQVS